MRTPLEALAMTASILVRVHTLPLRYLSQTSCSAVHPHMLLLICFVLRWTPEQLVRELANSKHQVFREGVFLSKLPQSLSERSPQMAYKSAEAWTSLITLTIEAQSNLGRFS
jgi:hypothetical protein